MADASARSIGSGSAVAETSNADKEKLARMNARGETYTVSETPEPSGDFMPKPGPRHPDKRQLRIEALRAASRVVAAMISGKDIPPSVTSEISPSVTEIAEQFVRWLEEG